MQKEVVVCVAIYNEEKAVASMIKSLFSQKMPLGFGIHLVIIASGCTDLTIPKIKEFIKQEYSISLIEEETRTGKTSALVHLFKFALKKDSEYCIFTDGDVLLEEDSIRHLIFDAQNIDDVDAVCGKPIPVKGSGFWYNIALENSNIWDITRKILSKEKQAWPLSGYLYLIRTKSLVLEIPQTIVAEDSFIGLKMILDGHKIAYNENAEVLIGYPRNLFDYYKQKARTRFGWRQLSRISPLKYSELKRVQYKVIFQRVTCGNYWSLICWFLDFIVNKTDQLFSLVAPDRREVWSQVVSSKDLENE